MSCVHYKYKNSLDYDTITFDGLHISLNDLRQAIMAQKKIGKSNDFVLQVVNAQTKEEYKGDGTLIPRNASVIVRRAPIGASIAEDQGGDNQAGEVKAGPTVLQLSKTADLSKVQASEEDKIEAMMNQATEDYDPSRYQKVRSAGRGGGGGGGGGGAPHPNYICYKCNKPGHHIRNCPLNGIKKATGIPQTILRPAQSVYEPGVMITSTGQLVVPVVDPNACSRFRKGTEKGIAFDAKAPTAESKPVPAEMTCLLCRELMTDAVLIPCCGRSYCDDCIRNYLLENNFVCPETDCKQQNVSPDNLIPNRMLRKTIENFKNSKLFSGRLQDIPKDKAVKKQPAPAMVKLAEKKALAEVEEVKVNASGRDSTPEQEDIPRETITSKPSSPSPLAAAAAPPVMPVGVPPVPSPFIPRGLPSHPGGGVSLATPMYAMDMYPSAHPMMAPSVMPHGMGYPQPLQMPVPLPPPMPYIPRFPVLGVERPSSSVGLPMSKEEFYRRQEEMRRRRSRSVSRSSRSGTPSVSSSYSSASRSSSSSPPPSKSRSGKRRHRRRRHRLSDSYSPLPSSSLKSRKRRQRSRSKSRSPPSKKHRRRNRSLSRSLSRSRRRSVNRKGRSRSPSRNDRRRNRSRTPRARSRHGSRSRTRHRRKSRSRSLRKRRKSSPSVNPQKRSKRNRLRQKQLKGRRKSGGKKQQKEVPKKEQEKKEEMERRETELEVSDKDEEPMIVTPLCQESVEEAVISSTGDEKSGDTAARCSGGSETAEGDEPTLRSVVVIEITKQVVSDEDGRKVQNARIGETRDLQLTEDRS